MRYTGRMSPSAAVERLLATPSAPAWVVGPKAPARRRFASLRRVVLWGLVGAALSWGGVSNELVAQVARAPSAPAAPLLAQPQWVDAESPLTEVGLRPSGELDSGAMLQSWKAAGLSYDDSLLLIRALQALPPTVLVRDDPEWEVRALQGRAHFQALLEDTFPKALASLDAQAQRPFRRRTQGRWTPHEWAGLLAAWEHARALPNVERPDQGLSLAAARQALANGRDTGLRALTISWNEWESTERLAALAKDLRAANRELGAVTGWRGPVLGLDGQVALTVGYPAAHTGALGTADIDDRGVVRIVAGWDSMAHEWLHGLDFASGRRVPVASDGLLMSEQTAKPLRLHRDYGQARAWPALMGGIEDSSPTWFGHKRTAHALGPGGETPASAASRIAGGYWLSPHETLAFAFESLVNGHPAVRVLADPSMGLRRHEQPHRHPSPEETRAQAPYWEAFFADTATLLPAPALDASADKAPKAAPRAPVRRPRAGA